MTTIMDVARAAGLSTATVSRALRSPGIVAEATRERVMRAVEQVQYRPNLLARNLRTDRSFAILVLVPGIANSFFSDVIAGIESVAWRHGYSVFLGDTRDSREREQHYEQLVDNRLADGVIQLSPDYGFEERRAQVTWPVVHACGCDLTEAPSVRIDNVGAAKEMVDHLVASGNRRIGAICGPRTNPHAMERLAGYRLGLDFHDIAFDRDLVRYGDFSLGSGHARAEELIGLATAPTAIFCMNDEMAIGAIQAIRASGRDVPGDVAVAGFDDIAFAAYATPSLTTIAQPARAMGEQACTILIDRIERKDDTDRIVVMPHTLRIRDSTRPR
jgi:LacI family transcriptional regulator, repressor for deo operon, udp, cdd, tsx, nupC, and nupG